MSSQLVLMFSSDFHAFPLALQQQVYHEFYKMVYPMVYGIVRDHGLTEDLIQESFMRVMRKAEQLQEADKLEWWLKVLTRNVALNYLRKIKRNRDELESEGVFETREIASTAAEVPVEQEVEARMMKEAIAKYLAKLKPEHRQIIELRWMHQLSYKEIGSILNFSEEVVRQKLFRARESIRKRLKEDWGIEHGS
jgi:RNA polymerase sigma-70 factor (ECF subfamily)